MVNICGMSVEKKRKKKHAAILIILQSYWNVISARQLLHRIAHRKNSTSLYLEERNGTGEARVYVAICILLQGSFKVVVCELG